MRLLFWYFLLSILINYICAFDPNSITKPVALEARTNQNNFRNFQSSKEDLRNSVPTSDMGIQTEKFVSLEEVRKCIYDIDHESGLQPFMTPREVVLSIVTTAGVLASAFRFQCVNSPTNERSYYAMTDDSNKYEKGLVITSLIFQIIRLADACHIDLPLAVFAKMKLNGLKYPVNLVKGRSGKYTDYQKETGISVHEQKTEMAKMKPALNGWSEDPEHTFEGVRRETAKFAKEREWDQYHLPRNLCLAMLGELGELCELFQWKGDEGNIRYGELDATYQCTDDNNNKLIAISEKDNSKMNGQCKRGLQDWTGEARDKVAQEIADVFIYLTRLADVANIPMDTFLIEAMNDIKIQSKKKRSASIRLSSAEWFSPYPHIVGGINTFLNRIERSNKNKGDVFDSLKLELGKNLSLIGVAIGSFMTGMAFAYSFSIKANKS